MSLTEKILKLLAAAFSVFASSNGGGVLVKGLPASTEAAGSSAVTSKMQLNAACGNTAPDLSSLSHLQSCKKCSKTQMPE